MFDLSNARPAHLWYFAGLITSDGCLLRDRRHITLTSKDYVLLHQLKQTLGLSCGVGRQIGFRGRVYFRLQIYSTSLYRHLLNVGLTPSKSVSLGALNLSMPHFHDFLRGLIDGDGNIHTWIHSGNGIRQWALRISSAAPVFAYWLKSLIEEFFAVRGSIHVEEGKQHPIYTIKFGKLSAKVILRACYYDGCLTIPRKFASAKWCIETPHGVKKYGDVVAGVAKQ